MSVDVRACLAAIGWGLAQWDDGTPYAIDSHNGAIRIAERWGPNFEPCGRWTCGSRGPSGAWSTFESAVEVAHAYHLVGALRSALADRTTEANLLRAHVGELEAANKRLTAIADAARRVTDTRTTNEVCGRCEAYVPLDLDFVHALDDLDAAVLAS